jgi:DNA-binding beta-propeller fold protein YncE/mono/diheme cytochrome c family protein
MVRLALLCLVGALCGLAASCGDEPAPAPTSAASGSAASVTPPVAPAVAGVAPSTARLADRSASALARSPDGKTLFLADEDHATLRQIPLPVDVSTPSKAIVIPGRPAQVLAFEDRLLVTVREPGMLIELVLAGDSWTENRRLDLPDDAWGLAVSADGKTALVASAWTHQVSAIDLATLKLRWTVNAAREPRGIAIAESGAAYVSHLVGSRVTKIADVSAATPKVTRIEVAPSPLKSPPGRLLPASLGFTALLSPDASKLFLPRHAIGAQGVEWWFGSATVDVMTTATETTLAPRASARGGWGNIATGDLFDVDGLVALSKADFVQPRAAVYRRSTDTLLVASEGTNTLVELDARALDPSLATKRVYQLAKYDAKEEPHPSLVLSGGAPTAIALSADEKVAWVYCRSTNDLSIVTLDETGPIPFVHLTDDSLGEDAQRGKRLFYDATDGTISGGLGCAGCHPDGRDDGHVWHEIVKHDGKDGKPVEPAEPLTGYRGIAAASAALIAGVPRLVEPGVPRQTPMIAGRTKAAGPYGWRAEATSLDARLRGGFALHRWQGSRESAYAVVLDRPKWIAAFVREGLPAPRVRERPLDEVEQRGKALFESEAVGCATCHWPAHDFTNGQAVLLERPRHAGFDEEPVPFKTPSLLFVGGTPPYYHDGSVSSLEELVRRNGKAMGSTFQLSADDQGALAAYLRTLGGYVPPLPEETPPKLPEEVSDPASPARSGTRPPRAAWAAVEPFARLGGCELRRKDGFLQLGCSGTVTVVAGSLAGAEVWAAAASSPFETSGPATIVVPLRQGERRVFQNMTSEAVGKWGVRSVPMGLVQVHWPEGAPEPTFTGHVD